MILIAGSIAFDYILNFPDEFSNHILADKIHQINISFTTETFRKEFGGTAGNQAYTLSLLGIKTSILSTAGHDFSGYKRYLDNVGVNTKFIKIRKDQFTASGFVITDKSDNQIWGYSLGALKFSHKLHFPKDLREILLVVIAPPSPDSIMHFVNLSQKAKLPYTFDPAFYIPTLSAVQLKKALNGAIILFGNDYEIAQIEKKVGCLKKWLENPLNYQSKITHINSLKYPILVTTLGYKGSLIKYKDAQSKTIKQIKIGPAKPHSTSDPTGAGDAYRAGFLAGLLKNMPLAVCGQIGSVASVYTVEKYGTITHKFTIKEFCRRYKLNFSKDLNL